MNQQLAQAIKDHNLATVPLRKEPKYWTSLSEREQHNTAYCDTEKTLTSYQLWGKLLCYSPRVAFIFEGEGPFWQFYLGWSPWNCEISAADARNFFKRINATIIKHTDEKTFLVEWHPKKWWQIWRRG